MEYCNYYYIRSNDELYHHGVKGMKWGVRRYQNKDGSLTPAGKRRQAKQEYNAERKAAKAKYKSTQRDISGSDPDRNKRIAKKVATAVIMTATVSAAAALYAKNPKAVNDVVAKMSNTAVSGLKKGSKAYKTGKQFVKDAFDGAKEGFKEIGKEARAGAKEAFKAGVKEAYAGAKEGVKEGVRKAPKKVAETVITGAALLAAKQMLDKSVGKEKSAQIFQANNNKKISSFWKVGPEDKDDDE